MTTDKSSGNANTSKRVQLNRATRHTEWLQLYTGGATFVHIADTYGVHYTSVRDVILRALAEAAAERRELADLALDLQLARYDRLWDEACRALDESKNGREVGRAQLISAARGVLDSKTKLLGLDQPQRTEVTITQTSDIDRELAGMAQALRDKARADADAAGIDAPAMPVLDGIVESVEE
ncbi:hypothetical protein L5G28_07670 [Gordonia sp. HY285]|uniref:hypothetical protein n=1 Tax=Gordonia liuliyuniae TaxID=2911517 RepID=UPI001F273F0E|nr:hypothetical protein [Gordonia liuliyuniae]MCF8610039.1 hypothetical protein [Gordonia liuliyuniae]